ncbi:MAG: hypothetical protein ACLSHC_17965, partial [Bilophila wadsworthia]
NPSISFHAQEKKNKRLDKLLGLGNNVSKFKLKEHRSKNWSNDGHRTDFSGNGASRGTCARPP